MKVKAVCASCNNTWMAGIEGDVKPYIAGMIQGRGRVLHRDGQTRLGLWAVLKTMMFECNDPAGPLVPREHFQHLYEQKTIPPDTFVWTGRVDPGHGPHKQLGLYESHGLGTGPAHSIAREDVEAYAATLSVNHLVVKVFGVTGTERRELIHGTAARHSIQRIWPVEIETFTWPPGPTLDVAGLGQLARGTVG